MTTTRTWASAIVTLLLCACTKVPQPFLEEYASIDLLIENGQVLDGLGGDARDADVVVVDNKIVFVGDAQFSDDDMKSRVVRRIDASGRIVSPGFIDLHAHGDPLETPGFENFLAMGATTITLGQDGSSPAVADLSAWLDEVADNGIGPNLAMFVGHGTLRSASGIGRAEVPDPADLERMLDTLDTALESTFGMSTGLEYSPGLYAQRDELLALARVVGGNGRMIMSHVRNEDDDQIENSIAELLDQGQYARVHVSHLKSVFGKGVERADEILGILANARETGVNVTADVYPYSASYTGIDIVFPAWAKTVEQFETAKVERREELAEFLRNRVNRRNGPEATLLGTPPYTGKTLADLAHELEMPFEDVLIDVIGPDGASGAYFVMNDSLQTQLLTDPVVGVCSDGSPTGFHPRGHGTFARIIEKHVVQDKVLSLPEAVRKMTSFAAEILGLQDRGVVREGMLADLLVFDPAQVHENATYPEPHQLASGFDVVIVNGKVAFENGHRSDELFGNVLRPSFNFVEATVDDIQSAISSGEMSCQAVVSGYLQRIDAYDQSSGLNAVIFTNPDAMAKAQEVDRKVASGEELGPLFCAPVLLKDNFDTADMPTSGGSIALKDSTPPDDAFMVRKLREADAIIIAKTNMAEWAFSPKQTISSSYGTTANAYDLDRVPAGSSGGTASGTAASFGVIGMGSDTGNSIRGPASHLALFGIRSTLGLTSRDGIIPLVFDRDIAGPMTRTVTDGVKVFDVIAGYDAADPYTELGRDHVESDYTTFLDKDALEGKRIGVLRALVDTEDDDPEVTAVFEQALVDLRAAGATLVDPFVIENLDAHMDADNFCVRFRYDMREYLKSLGDDAPIQDVLDVLDSKQYDPYIEDRLKFFGSGPPDIHPSDLDTPCPDYPDHPGRQAYLADVISSMDDAGVDAIVYPGWTNPPAHIDNAIEEYKGDNSQLVAPATGLPAVTVPMGYSYGHLPAGLQILGRPYSEGLLIGLAYAYEQRTQHRVPPELFPELKGLPR